MVACLTVHISCAEDLSEALEATDPLVWVSSVHSIQARVREMVTAELICK